MIKETENTKEDDEGDIYAIYESIYPTKLNLWRKNNLLTNLMGGYASSWKVVGVSENAIEALRKYEKKEETNKGVHRAHIVSRKNVTKDAFSANGKLDREKFLNLFDQDYTILVGKGENKTDLDGSLKVIRIEPEDDLFRCARVAFKYGKKEKDWLKKLQDEKKPEAILLKSLLESLNIVAKSQ